MPPKRKTASAFPDNSPTKRLTRSSSCLLPDTPISITNITPKKPLKSYERNSSRTSLITKKTNGPKKDEDMNKGGWESSEDELNLSPSRSYNPLRKTSSGLVEVVILTKRRLVNSDVDDPHAFPVQKRNLTDEQPYHSSRTTNNHVDPYEQDNDDDSEDICLLSSTKLQKIPPSTKVFTSSENLRKRRLDSEDGDLSPPPSPKKLKAVTASRTSQAPACIADNQRSPSPTRRYTRSATFALPQNEAIKLPASSPSKNQLSCKQIHLPQEIPPHLHPCLVAQKKAILRALHHGAHMAFHGDEDEENEEDETATNEVAFQQVTDLLIGTVTRGEGNSCLLLGPRGSGKTSVRVRALCQSGSDTYFLSSLNNAYQTSRPSLLYFVCLAGHNFPTAWQCAKLPINLASRLATAFYLRKTAFLSRRQITMTSIIPS